VKHWLSLAVFLVVSWGFAVVSLAQLPPPPSEATTRNLITRFLVEGRASIAPVLNQYLQEAFSALLPILERLLSLLAKARSETISDLRRLYRTGAILFAVVSSQFKEVERVLIRGCLRWI